MDSTVDYRTLTSVTALINQTLTALEISSPCGEMAEPK